MGRPRSGKRPIRVHLLKRSFERRISKTGIIVVLLGAGGRGLKQRRILRQELTVLGIIALIPEDDFPKEIAPSLCEEAMLSKGDIELAFVNVQSWGTATEFAQFHKNSTIAPKLRVLVPHEYHPLYGNSKSYLTDLYLTHTAIFGHVYAIDDARTSAFPPSRQVIMKLAERYRQCKVLGLLTR